MPFPVIAVINFLHIECMNQFCLAEPAGFISINQVSINQAIKLLHFFSP